MNDQKQQIIEKLQAANNILVTVSSSPSVDQLAACIGMTLLLNKMKKHATAVFSGAVPPIITFLKPEETIEKNTDSLRDFIIALDKAKADKLRYKVEDEVVKIFITPYKSSISEKDLIFSQGDFNVDVVLALGVHRQEELDEAITAHGRILHDAVVISINNTADGELGTINWQADSASGMSELAAGLAVGLGEDLLDEQIATSLLTGIVAETDHFGNQKTTPQVMTTAATLLAAGANQQLVAKELGHIVGDAPASMPVTVAESEAGVLQLPKDTSDEAAADEKSDAVSDEDTAKLLASLTESTDESAEKTVEKPKEQTKEKSEDKAAEKPADKPADDPKAEAEEPASESIDDLLRQAEDDLIATSVVELPEAKAPAIKEPLKLQPLTPEEKKADEPAAEPATPAESEPPTPEKTLSDIEQSVHSPHLEGEVTDEPAAAETPELAEEVDSARKAVEDALKGTPQEVTDPLEAINALDVNLDLGHDDSAAEPAFVPAAPPTPLVQPAAGFTSPPGPAADLPGFIETPIPPIVQAPEPGLPPLPFNPAGPLPGMNVPPPLSVPPTSTTLPPQGPPPPPSPPPFGPAV